MSKYCNALTSCGTEQLIISMYLYRQGQKDKEEILVY
jgi:hypothetical protein